MHALNIKCAYEKPLKSDGFRILIDRTWPPGITEKEARIDLWLQDIAPSEALLAWFNRNESRWREFQKRYAKELENKYDLLNTILAKAHKHTVSLIYSSTNRETNHAIALCVQLQFQLLKLIH